MKTLHGKTAEEWIDDIENDYMELDEDQQIAIQCLVECYGTSNS